MIIYPDETSFLQFISDNTDHNLTILDSKNTHQGLGIIAIANENFQIVQFNDKTFYEVSSWRNG